VQTLGVLPLAPVATLYAGTEVCEGPIALVEAVDAVGFNVASLSTPGPRITVRLTDETGKRTLRRETLFPMPVLDARALQVLLFDRIAGEQYVNLCFTNEGLAPLKIFGDMLGGLPQCTPSGRLAEAAVICRPGGVRPTLSPAIASINGLPLFGDISAVFFRRDGNRTLLSRIEAIPDRASRFRPAWVSPNLWWVLLGGWLVLLPALVGFAMVRALSARAPGSTPRSRGSRRAR